MKAQYTQCTGLLSGSYWFILSCVAPQIKETGLKYLSHLADP